MSLLIPPLFYLRIGSADHSLSPTTSDHSQWVANHQILDADNGTISWSISGKDRAGNQLELSSNELITGLDFDQFNQYGYEVDSTDPKIVDIRISNTNQATKYSNPNVQLVKTGDNITIEFTLSEPITQPGLSLKFGADNASGILQVPLR